MPNKPKFNDNARESWKEDSKKDIYVLHYEAKKQSDKLGAKINILRKSR